MKNFWLGLLLAAVGARAGMAAEICKIPEGKESAITITYDDGSYSHYTHALPTHVKYNVPGTFLIITDKVEDDADTARGHKYVSWKELKEMQDKGMEIGTHTKSHRNMREIESKDVTKEMTQGKKRDEVFALREKNYPELREEVVGSVKALTDHGLKPPLAIAFAGNACPDWTWRLLGEAHLYLRKPSLISTGRGDTPERYEKMLAEKLKPGTVGVIMLHGLGTKTPGDGWNPITEFSTYEALIEKISKMRDKVHVGGHGEVMRYHECAKACKLKDNKDGTFTIAHTSSKFNPSEPVKLWLRAAAGEKIAVNGQPVAPDANGIFTANIGDTLKIEQ